MDGHGACPKWRLGFGAEAMAARLEGIGSALVFRRGRAEDVLTALVEETGAEAVFWSRAYDPAAIARDTGVKAALKARGVEARSFAGHVLFEPWTVETGQGGFYRVYTPFWRAVQGREVAAPLPPVTRLMPPEVWPASDDPGAWGLAGAMDRGAEVVRPTSTSARRRRRRGWRSSSTGGSAATPRRATCRARRGPRGCRRT
jgi:deoxyribodipyrimidine photo-lyase